MENWLKVTTTKAINLDSVTAIFVDGTGIKVGFITGFGQTYEYDSPEYSVLKAWLDDQQEFSYTLARMAVRDIVAEHILQMDLLTRIREQVDLAVAVNPVVTESDVNRIVDAAFNQFANELKSQP